MPNDKLILDAVNRVHDRIDGLEKELGRLRIAVIGDEKHEGLISEFRGIKRVRKAVIWIVCTVLSSIALAKAEQFYSTRDNSAAAEAAREITRAIAK